ncbi:MAG: hypothetical protein ABGW69_01795 [Nanoarchaeota archaeon]
MKIKKVLLLISLFLIINFKLVFSIKIVAFYYGWLNITNLSQFKNFNFIIVADKNKIELIKLKNPTKVFIYYPFGSLYGKENESKFKKETKNFIENYSFINGLFFDEVDTGYFSNKKENFNKTLKEIINFAHSKGLKVIINGQRFFANYSDYYLWESFLRNSKGKFVNFFSNKTNGWESNYDKYLYLKKNNLLNKTIVLFYGTNKKDIELAFLIAQALNFSYFAYCNKDCFANTKPIILKLKPKPIKKVIILENKGIIIITNEEKVFVNLNRTYYEQNFIYEIKKVKNNKSNEKNHSIKTNKILIKSNLNKNLSSHNFNNTSEKLKDNLSINFSKEKINKISKEENWENNFIIGILLKIKELLFSFFS